MKVGSRHENLGQRESANYFLLFYFHPQIQTSSAVFPLWNSALYWTHTLLQSVDHSCLCERRLSTAVIHSLPLNTGFSQLLLYDNLLGQSDVFFMILLIGKCDTHYFFALSCPRLSYAFMSWQICMHFDVWRSDQWFDYYACRFGFGLFANLLGYPRYAESRT